LSVGAACASMRSWTVLSCGISASVAFHSTSAGGARRRRAGKVIDFRRFGRPPELEATRHARRRAPPEIDFRHTLMRAPECCRIRAKPCLRSSGGAAPLTGSVGPIYTMSDCNLACQKRQSNQPRGRNRIHP
jgi:hypothetical protein